MKKHHKKICKRAHLGSTLLTSLFHFVFCGLPALIALFGAVLGVSSISSLSFITAEQRSYILVIGGILLLTSIIVFYKEKGCCEDLKMRFAEKIILIISGGFFSLGLLFHLISIATLAEPACH